MNIKNRFTKVAAVSLTAGAVVIGGLGFAGTASADGGTPGTPPAGAQTARRPGPGAGTASPTAVAQVAIPGWFSSDLLAVSAQQIGISKAQLQQEMASGSSVAQVAGKHGIAYATIKTTLVDAGDADLQKATAAGSVTQDQANQVVSTIPKIVESFLARSSRAAGTGGPGADGSAPRFNNAPGAGQRPAGGPNRPGR